MLASLSQTNFVKDCWRYRFTPNASIAVGTTLQSHTISWNEKAFLLIFFSFTRILFVYLQPIFKIKITYKCQKDF